MPLESCVIYSYCLPKSILSDWYFSLNWEPYSSFLSSSFSFAISFLYWRMSSRMSLWSSSFFFSLSSARVRVPLSSISFIFSLILSSWFCVSSTSCCAVSNASFTASIRSSALGNISFHADATTGASAIIAESIASAAPAGVIIAASAALNPATPPPASANALVTPGNTALSFSIVFAVLAIFDITFVPNATTNAEPTALSKGEINGILFNNRSKSWIILVSKSIPVIISWLTLLFSANSWIAAVNLFCEAVKLSL